jgi:hypothetical protein
VAENMYQAKLIRKLKKMFPGCEILKNDANLRQGILDLQFCMVHIGQCLKLKIRLRPKNNQIRIII